MSDPRSDAVRALHETIARVLDYRQHMTGCEIQHRAEAQDGKTCTDPDNQGNHKVVNP